MPLNDEGITTRVFDGEEYLNMTNAAKYAGYSSTGLRNLLDRLAETPDKIKVWQFPGVRDKYIKKADLKAFFSPREVN